MAHVRNFWIEIEVDGRKSKIACGPRGKDGGFDLTIKMRRNGVICNEEIVIVGRVFNKFETINDLLIHVDVPGQERTTIYSRR